MAMEYEVSSVNSASSPPAFSSDSQVHDDKSGEDLSPEDVAWIDSCLIKEPEISATKWDSMKVTLSKTLSSETGFHEENEAEEMVVEEPNQLRKLDAASEDTPSKTPLNLSPDEEEVNDQRPLSFHRNPFLPSYSEESEPEAETVASLRSDPESAVDVTEPPNGDEIFRVWDLNVPAEENELGVQLKNVLAGDASVAREDLGSVSIDDVIDRVSKISLSSSDSSL